MDQKDFAQFLQKKGINPNDINPESYKKWYESWKSEELKREADSSVKKEPLHKSSQNLKKIGDLIVARNKSDKNSSSIRKSTKDAYDRIVRYIDSHEESFMPYANEEQVRVYSMIKNELINMLSVNSYEDLDNLQKRVVSYRISNDKIELDQNNEHESDVKNYINSVCDVIRQEMQPSKMKKAGSAFIKSIFGKPDTLAGQVASEFKKIGSEIKTIANIFTPKVEASSEVFDEEAKRLQYKESSPYAKYKQGETTQKSTGGVAAKPESVGEPIKIGNQKIYPDDPMYAKIMKGNTPSATPVQSAPTIQSPPSETSAPVQPTIPRAVDPGIVKRDSSIGETTSDPSGKMYKKTATGWKDLETGKVVQRHKQKAIEDIYKKSTGGVAAKPSEMKLSTITVDKIIAKSISITDSKKTASSSVENKSFESKLFGDDKNGEAPEKKGLFDKAIDALGLGGVGAGIGGIAKKAGGAVLRGGKAALGALGGGSAAMGATMIGAGLAGGAAIDYGFGKLGVGKDKEGNDIQLNEEQDDNNWEKMSFWQKVQSGAARGIEKAGRFAFLGNMANEAASKRIAKETEYLDSESQQVTPGNDKSFDSELALQKDKLGVDEEKDPKKRSRLELKAVKLARANTGLLATGKSPESQQVTTNNQTYTDDRVVRPAASNLSSTKSDMATNYENMINSGKMTPEQAISSINEFTADGTVNGGKELVRRVTEIANKASVKPAPTMVDRSAQEIPQATDRIEKQAIEKGAAPVIIQQPAAQQPAQSAPSVIPIKAPVRPNESAFNRKVDNTFKI